MSSSTAERVASINNFFALMEVRHNRYERVGDSPRIPQQIFFRSGCPTCHHSGNQMDPMTQVGSGGNFLTIFSQRAEICQGCNS